MRLFAPGGKLRLEERGEEETLVREIEGAHFVVRAARGDAQPGGFPAGHVFRIRFEIAEILALYGIRSAQVMHERALNRMDGIFSMQLGAVHPGSFFIKGFTKGGHAFRKGASDGSNHDICGIRIVFGGVRIVQAQHIAREFDERVLESGTGSQIRQVPPARELNAAQHADRTAERTAGRSPESIEVSQEILRIPAFQRFSGKPARFDVEAKPGRGVKQRCFRGPMGMLLEDRSRLVTRFAMLVSWNSDHLVWAVHTSIGPNGPAVTGKEAWGQANFRVWPRLRNNPNEDSCAAAAYLSCYAAT